MSWELIMLANQFAIQLIGWASIGNRSSSPHCLSANKAWSAVASSVILEKYRKPTMHASQISNWVVRSKGKNDLMFLIAPSL